MTDNQTIQLGCAGLVSDPGPFSGLPPGSLVQAENVSFRRPGVIEPRVPFYLYVDAALSANADCYNTFAYYDGSTTARYWQGKDGSTSYLRRNATTTITGGFTHTRDKAHFVQSSGRGLVTTDQGVAVVDGNSATSLRLAGVPRGPAFMGLLSTGTGAWLAASYVIGYRTCVARSLNGTLSRGAPSEVRYLANNSEQFSSAATYPTIRIYITPDIVANDIIEVYRLSKALGVLTSTYYTVGSPADEGRLRLSFTVTASDISEGYIEFIDLLPDENWDGPYLYTNASQEGILLGNERPNYARDIALYNGMTFYAGQQSPQRVTLACNGTGIPEDLGAPPPFTNSTDTSRRLCGFVTTGNIASGTNTITLTTAAHAAYLVVGMRVTDGSGPSTNPELGTANLPANVYVTNINTLTGVVTLSANATGTSVGAYLRFYDWLEVDDGTTKRKIYTVYGYSLTEPVAGIRTSFLNFFVGTSQWHEIVSGGPPTYCYAGGSCDIERAWAAAYPTATFRVSAVASGTQSNQSITIRIERTDSSLGSFTVRSSKPLAFDRYVDSVTGVTSAQEGNPGQLAWSKLSQPEAVPLPYFNVLGDTTRPIHRIAATRDALYIFKADGIWRCFGDDPESLTFQLLDSSAGLSDNAPNMVTTFGADVYAWTGRGIVRIGAGGVVDIDQAISRSANGALGYQMSATKTWAASSSMGPWVAFGMDTTATGGNQGQAWVYNPELGTWSTWTFRRTVIAGSSDSINTTVGFANGYAFPADSDYVDSATVPGNGDVLQTRVPAITNIVGNAITISAGYAWTPAVGDAITDGVRYAYVTGVSSATQFTVNSASGFGLGDITPIENNTTKVYWTANPGGTPATVKQWVNSFLVFSRIRYGSSFLAKWQGYKNPTERTNTHEYDSTWAAFNTPKPYQRKFNVPTQCGRDWALKVGFEWSTAATWFACDGCAVSFNVVGDRV